MESDAECVGIYSCWKRVILFPIVDKKLTLMQDGGSEVVVD